MNAVSVGLLLAAGGAGADPSAPAYSYPALPSYHYAPPPAGHVPRAHARGVPLRNVDPATLPGARTGATQPAPVQPAHARDVPPAAPAGVATVGGGPATHLPDPAVAAHPGQPKPGCCPPAAGPAPRALGDLCATNLPDRNERKRFQSDLDFEGFVGPITNPILAKDPRSNTHARFLFVNNSIPASTPLGGGTFQVYGLQVNLALTERLSFIADKDGLIHLNPRVGPDETGFANVAAGFKYTFLRDTERQALAAVGLMYEIPSGEAKVFQNQGSGALAPFLTVGKEFGDKWHYLQTTGYFTPLRAPDGSSFVFNSFHIDRQLFGRFYPLAELNWFWYTSGGNRLPDAVGEGDGLVNLGTRGMAGNHIVTVAAGAKYVVSRNLHLGAAYEFPLTRNRDLINNRLTVEAIVRY